MATVRTPRTGTRLARRTAGAPVFVEIEVLARDAGLHPDLVRRFVQLGLLEPRLGTDLVPRFPATRRLAWRAPTDCAATCHSATPAPYSPSSCSRALTNSKSG